MIMAIHQNRGYHLVFLLTQDLESPSGLGRYFPWAKFLVQEGFNVTILALHSNYPSLSIKEFIRDGVNIKYVAQMHVHKSDHTTHYFSPSRLVRVSWRATRALYHAGMETDSDLIIIGKPHPMNSLAGIRLARKKHVPVVVDCDDYEAESNHTSSQWQKLMLRFFEDSTPKKSDLITTNTYFNKNRLIKLGISESKIHYVPNGVDVDRFQTAPQAEIEKYKRELGLENKKVVAYLGSLSLANHPVNVLIEAFAEAAKKIDDARLLIVGGGKDFENLKELSRKLGISEKVIFTGKVPPEKMNLYYSLTDISVDPVNDTLADHGRCPLKIFESWQMGVPVVSADVGDRKILAGDPPSIRLSYTNTTDELSQILLELIQDKNALDDLKNNGRKRIRDFLWAGIAHESAEIFADLIDQAKRKDG